MPPRGNNGSWIEVVEDEVEGEVALISAKAVHPALGSKICELFGQAAVDVMREHTDKYRPTRCFVATYRADAVRLPSKATAYRILDKLDACILFRASVRTAQRLR
jgi:hypothetical protein